MPDRFIVTTEDLLGVLDDLLEAQGGAWWDGFFADRSKPVPFFAEWPDENLLEWFGDGLLEPGRVLELGSTRRSARPRTTSSTTRAASTISRRIVARTTWNS